MFGWVNDCTECLIVSKYGEETWHRIKEKADCPIDDGGFLRYQYYADAVTVRLVVAASEVLGMSVDDVLLEFGDYFIDYAKDNGYDNVMQCLGSNLRDWLSNLNSLHDHLQASYPEGFVAPVFWSDDDEVENCETVNTGISDRFPENVNHGGNNAILVHYFSHRGSLLVPLVVGLIKRIAKDYFGIDINMDQLQLQDDDAGINNTTWRVTTVDVRDSHKLRGKTKNKKKKNQSRRGVGLGGGDIPVPPTREDDDLETVTTVQTSKTNYEKIFDEGKAQAATLRVQELVKRSFYHEECELYHALTLEHFLSLSQEWTTNQIGEDRWCYDVWSLQDGDPNSWPSLSDLPPRLNPLRMTTTDTNTTTTTTTTTSTIDPATTNSSPQYHCWFGGKIPATGRFPPNDDGTLQSFPPLLRLVNEITGRTLWLQVEQSADLTLEDAIFNSPVVIGAGLKEFPTLTDRIASGEYEIQVTIWNEENGTSYHSFAIGDLRTTSTSQLFDLVTPRGTTSTTTTMRFFDPIVIHFQCLETVSAAEDEEDI